MFLLFYLFLFYCIIPIILINTYYFYYFYSFVLYLLFLYYVTQCHTFVHCLESHALITCHGTIPMPTSWQTTSSIRHRHPACGHRVHPERRCAGGTEWFRCLQQVQLQVFPEYFEWGWRREQASCNQARTQLESPQTRIPANLNQIISIIAIINIICVIVIIDIMCAPCDVKPE